MITVANRAKLCFFTFLNHNFGADNWLIAENSNKNLAFYPPVNLSSSDSSDCREITCIPRIFRVSTFFFTLTTNDSAWLKRCLKSFLSWWQIEPEWCPCYKWHSWESGAANLPKLQTHAADSDYKSYFHISSALLQHEDKKWQVIHWIFFSLYSSSTLFQVLFPLVLSAQDRGQRRRSYHQPRVHQAAHLYLNLTALIHCAQV